MGQSEVGLINDTMGSASSNSVNTTQMSELHKDFLTEHYMFMSKHDHQCMERGKSCSDLDLNVDLNLNPNHYSNKGVDTRKTRPNENIFE